MKPQTAAKKLGIYLPATPEEFQNTALTHQEFVELQSNPPEWLTNLRRNGPHPRPVVAQKLGITIAALKRNDLDTPDHRRHQSPAGKPTRLATCSTHSDG